MEQILLSIQSNGMSAGVILSTCIQMTAAANIITLQSNIWKYSSVNSITE
jgi:hypothetical protein